MTVKLLRHLSGRARDGDAMNSVHLKNDSGRRRRMCFVVGEGCAATAYEIPDALRAFTDRHPDTVRGPLPVDDERRAALIAAHEHLVGKHDPFGSSSASDVDRR